ncbi:MAG: serine hydrolase [Flavobacteriales bacterium]|nr:serine hydrolase [Flavobacteriales bacterium]
MSSFDKIFLGVFVLASGIHCSGINSDGDTNAFNSGSVPEFILDSSLSDEKIKTIDDYFLKRHSKGYFSGTYLFYDSGHYYSNAYGYANGKLRTKLTDQMPLQIASVSKTLTAFAILCLLDKGKINLETKIYEVLEEFPYKTITLEQLLSHKSGIPNYMNFAEGYFKQKYRHLNNDDVLWMLKRYRPGLEFRPGAKYKYSNTNYVLLALIVEKLSEVKFEDYMRDSVFKPIGMSSSFIFTPSMATADIEVQGHNGLRSVFPDFYQNGTTGDKGVYTSVHDLLKFDRALRNFKLLSESTLNAACTPHTPCRASMDYYGYGWRIRYYNTGDTIIYHNGWWQGFKAYFVRWKNKDRCIIVLTNTVSGGFIPQADLIALMDGEKPIPVKTPEDID